MSKTNSYTFEATTPVEYHEVQAPKGCPLRWLALPFYVYQVFAPEPGQRALNLFEKAVLGLLKAGNYQPDQLARYLKLDPDLIRLILADLIRKSLLDEQQRLTLKGQRILLDQDWLLDPDPSRFVTGFVYQSPWDGEFLPRFVRKRTFADVQPQADKKWPRMSLGSLGAPRFESPFFIEAKDNIFAPRSPKPKDILEIVRQHTLAIRFPGSSATVQTLPEDLPPSLRQINLMNPEPESVWLVTQAYFPQTGYNRDSWQILDTFGLGESSALKQLVASRAARFSPLQELLDGLYQSEAERLSSQANEIDRKIREEAQREVEREFGAVGEVGPIMEAIYTFSHAYHRYLNYDGDKGENVWGKAQIVLEVMFNTMKASNYEEALKAHPRKLELSPDFITRMYQRLGGSEVPELLSKVSGNKVAGWINYGNGSLRPMAIATLFVASTDSSHLFAKMIQDLPDIFNSIERISRTRDQVSHGAIESEAPLITPEETHEQVYSILKSYFFHRSLS